MNRQLKSTEVYHQPKSIPADLHIWQDENSGTAALMSAALDVVEGKTVRFALCDRDGTLPPTVAEIVTIAMGTDSPRYCGEDDDPEGAGSHALITSWYGYCKDTTAIAVQMARAFACNHKHYFRLA